MTTMKKGLSPLEKYAHYHIVILRIGLGLFMFFGWGLDKLSGGQELWAKLGGAMSTYGITFAPSLWGFMATFAESIAALCIAVGLFTRYGALLLGFTMLTVLLSRHTGDIAAFNLKPFATPFFILLMSVVLLLTGAGKIWNLEKKLFGKEH
jgi:putative oxidoreductase